MACAHEPHPALAAPGAGRRLGAAAAVSAVVMVAELIGGRLSHSVSLVADAGHIATDVLSLGVALLAHRAGRWPPRGRYTYGFRRWESLAAAFNGLTLVGVAGVLGAGALLRLGRPTVAVDAMTMLGAGGLSLVGNLVNVALLRGHRPDDVNTRGAFLHVLTDLICALGVVASAVVVKLTGLSGVDAASGLAIAVVVGLTGLRLVARTGGVLAQAAPDAGAAELARRTLAAVPGVRRVERLRLWTLTPGHDVLSAVLVVEGAARQQEVRGAAHALIGHARPGTEATFEVQVGPPSEGT